MARSYKGIGGGLYKDTKGKRKNQKFSIGTSGARVYRDGGKKVVVKPKAKKKKVDPYKSQVDAATDLEFGEGDQQLAKERRISRQAMSTHDAAWAGYQRDLEAARQKGQQGYQQAQGAVYQQANTARAQDQSQSSLMDAEAQKAAALRGTTAGPNVAAQAQASRNALSSSFGGLVGAQGAAQNSYMSDQGRIGGGIRALELGKEAGRGRVIEEEQRKSDVKKGAYRVAKRTELSDAAYKRRLEAAAFGLKEQDAAVSAADKAADNQRQSAKDRQDKKDKAAGRRVSQRGQSLTNARGIRGQDLTDQRAREKKAAGGKAKGGARRKAGYGATNVTVPVAVTNRKQWEDLVADSKRLNRLPKKAKGLMRTVLEEYAGGRGKVSKKTALKVFRVYGFRLPYEKPGQAGKGIRKVPKKTRDKIGNW